MSTYRVLTRLAGFLVVAGLVLAACSGSGGASASLRTTAESMDALIKDAKAEGNLTTIALPHDWCDYGDMLAGFTAKYGIKINELKPLVSSGEEVDAIKANKGNTGPQTPDVIDVGQGFAPQITGILPTAAASGQTPGPAEQLVAPYKVATWDTIPASGKDPSGMWVGDYYGVMAFETDTTRVKNVPKDWPDLLKPEYKGQVALSGNPTKSNQAISGVWASGFPGGGTLDSATQGLDFFKKLVDQGNFVPVIAGKATVASGETPIRITWTYNGLADRDSLAGNPKVEVAVPTSGRFGGLYIQAISKFAPHPNAARLWEEYIYSDEGQNIYLKGYCVPIRYDAMAAAGTLDSAALAKLPDAKGVQLPSVAQISAATEVITKGWPTVVGVTVPDK